MDDNSNGANRPTHPTWNDRFVSKGTIPHPYLSRGDGRCMCSGAPAFIRKCQKKDGECELQKDQVCQAAMRVYDAGRLPFMLVGVYAPRTTLAGNGKACCGTSRTRSARQEFSEQATNNSRFVDGHGFQVEKDEAEVQSERVRRLREGMLSVLARKSPQSRAKPANTRAAHHQRVPRLRSLSSGKLCTT